ncbi:MAG: DNA-binding protein [Candidatus Dadabacteria bacterium]|nr:MAG: DNA-binding protein [Candidatus Dadabacteria bacterium]
MTSSNKPLLLTVREVAELLRIHRPKVYDLIKSGTLDGFKLGADWRIRRESVEKLIGDIPPAFFSGEAEELNSQA